MSRELRAMSFEHLLLAVAIPKKAHSSQLKAHSRSSPPFFFVISKTIHRFRCYNTVRLDYL
jgi:hypothetical protein